MVNELQTSWAKSPVTSTTLQRTSARFGLARRQDPEITYLARNSMTSAKGTILIVGFNSITAEIIRLTLQGQGFCVQQAGNQETAIELADRFGPKLVLQNLDLPDMHAWDLIRRFRLLPRGARLPVLAVSEERSQLQMARNAGVGFAGFLCKPFLPSHLIHTIRFYLKAQTQSFPTHWGRSYCHSLVMKPTYTFSERVLVIEDNLFQRANLATSLTELGFEVLTADDGLETLQGARVRPPDAFIIDALMPRLNGFELCLVIRQDPRIAHIPVILTSAGPFSDVDSHLAREVGCNALVQLQADSAEVVNALVTSLREDHERPLVMEAVPIHFASYKKDGLD